MAVTITDRRTLIDEADSTTGWTGGVAPNPNTVIYCESTGSLAQIVSKTSSYLYHTHGSSIDCSGTGKLVYVWFRNRGDPLTKSAGGMGIVLGDAFDLVGYHLAGGDEAAFRHNTTNPYFMCMLLDTSRLPTDKKIWIGTDTLDYVNITQFGSEEDNGDAKAVGGVANFFTDVVRVGNLGLRITGGTTGDRGNFKEIADEDSSIATGKAYGIIRELSSGLYGLQGMLTFGNIAAGDSWFDDSDATIIFEDRLVENDKYKFIVEGNPGFGEETHFILSRCNIQTAGPDVLTDFSSRGIDELNIQNTNFTGMRQGFKLASDPDSKSHVFNYNKLSDCGPVSAGQVPIRNCSFQASTSAASGAVIWHDLINIKDSSFLNNAWGPDIVRQGGAPAYPSGFGITHPASGSFTYDNLTFTGNDADIYFSGRGTLTIQATNGSNPTTYVVDYADATVDIQNSVTLTLTNIVVGSEVRIYLAGTTTEVAGIESEDDGTFQYTYNYTGDFNVDIVIHHNDYVYYRLDNITMGSTPSSIPIVQQKDRWYNNP